MQEIEVEIKDADTLVPVLNIQKGNEGDTARVKVALCPTGDGLKESGRVASTGKEEVREGPELDSNPFQAWNDAVMDWGMPEEPKGAFDDWFAADEMDRLLCAIGPMRHISKRECGLSGLSGGFCTMCVVSVDSDGLVLGCKCGVSDGCSRSVTWSTRFVPKSLLMNRDLSTEEMALRLLDLPSKITAHLSETNGEEEEYFDFDEPDDGAEDEYMRERCERTFPI